MTSETMRFTISINSVEHQSVFEDLSLHTVGIERARRARWLMVSALSPSIQQIPGAALLSCPGSGASSARPPGTVESIDDTHLDSPEPKTEDDSMENEKIALRITFRIYSDEDAELFKDLSDFKGASRVRRLRAVLRAGLATLQHGGPQPGAAPHLVRGSVLSFPAGTKIPKPGSFEAYDCLGLDPSEFAFVSEANPPQPFNISNPIQMAVPAAPGGDS